MRPDDWWDAIYARYVSAFAECGWSDAAPHLLTTIRQEITDADGYVVFEDVVPALTRLRTSGWRHLVVSNHVPELPQIIDGLGLAGFFDAIVSSALVGYEKPRPELFAAARALTQDDGAVWMVGDNPDADCSGAVRFGVNAVLVRTATGF